MELLALFSAFLSSQKTEQLVFSCTDRASDTSGAEFQHVKDLFVTWIKIQSTSADSVKEFQESISRLEVGASLAYFIREQNASLIITNISNATDHRLRLSVFLASQSNETIYKSDGDLIAQLPGLCIDIPLSNVLQSDIFAEDLIRLCSTPFQPTIRTISKGGNELGNVNDIRHPMLVTQYLTTVLSDQHSSAVDPKDFHRVTKKIRDQVVIERNKGEQKLFRRSGLWFSIKVTFQLELINRFGQDTGLMLYKMLLLDFLTNCCMDWTTTDAHGEVSADLEYQMMAKISRRLAKIVVHPKNHSVSELGVQMFRNKVENGILRLKRKMDADWRDEISKYSKSRSIKPIRVNMELVEKSTVHVLNNSWPYFNQTNPSTELASVVPPPPGRERFRLTATTNYPERCLSSTKDEELLGLILFDFENHIFSLPSNHLDATKCKFFLGLLESYITAAKPYYFRDPVGASRMVLTCLKILQLLDVLAIEKYPMLKDHNSGVAEGVMSVLLATTKEDLEKLNEIENYFRARNQNSKTLPSLINNGKPTSDFFSVRFAAQDGEMKALRATILEETEQKCTAKRAELEQERKKCDRLREEVMKMECEWNVPSRKYPGRLNHNNYCKKCAKTKEIKACVVSLYEKPLPGNTECQNAIMFELLIPIEISCLRDALHLFLANLCSATQDEDCSGIQQKWTFYSQLIGHYKNPYQKHVTLGSTVKSSLGAFVASGQSQLHVDSPDEKFILENGLNCHMCTIATTSSGSDNSRVLKYAVPQRVVENVKKLCTFEVESGSAYAGMQWMLNSTKHSQNEVLASQFACPQNLQLAEFGSLRSGHLLQLRNLFRSLALESLSFREESVLSLVCQAIWEAGPPTATNGFHRESHADLVLDPHFTAEFISQLSHFMEKNMKNWNDQHILLIVILLCNRILSMRPEADQLRDQAIALALECRKVAIEWIKAIEKLLLTTNGSQTQSQSQGESSSSQDQDPDHVHAQQTKLRLKLVQISACGALTFAAAVPIPPETLSQWLLFIAKVDDNILLTNTNPKNLPTMTRNLLRWVRCVGVGLEHHFHDLSPEEVSQVLGEFAESQWSGTPGDMKDTVLWKRGESAADQWYTTECAGAGNGNGPTNNNILQMDIILGKFLVDGKPISRLPFAITSHADFKRMFGNFIFVVQTDGPSTYLTKDRFADGCRYKFQMTTTELVITEVMDSNSSSNGEEYQLVPHTKFEGDIPPLLILDHSHWWHKSKNVVEFRGQDFLAPGFRNDVKYQLDLHSRKLVDTTHHKSMIDINKLLYRDVGRVMSRLEMRKYVHVFQDVNEETGALLSISLPRIDLHFYVTQEGSIMSEEHRGCRVRESSQEFGTLIGLEHGLLLECKHSNIVLMPHGKLSAFPPEGDRQHHTVKINMETPRNPPVFLLEVDETLHRLKTQPVQGAWVYLAHLHALTSGVLPDPLTGLTGTESAMTLLQSPFCWSGEPMDEETRRTLHDIQALTPVRQHFPDHLREMEEVKFPTGIPSVCAHDGFIFLGHKLMADSARMAFAYPHSNQKSVRKLEEKKVKLVRRAYWRSAAIYSPQAQIRPDFDPEFTHQLFNEFTSLPTSSLDPGSSHKIAATSFSGSCLMAVRMLADLGHSWTAPPSMDSRVLVKTVCDSPSVTSPSSHTQFLDGFYDWVQVNIVQDWLSLYNYARIVQREGLQASWTLMLGAMAFYRNTTATKDCDAEDIVKHLEILQAIAVHHKEFLNLNPPPFEGSYTDTDEDEFDRQVLETELRKAAAEFEGCRDPKKSTESAQDYNSRYDREKDEHATQVKLQITKVLNELEAKFVDLGENVGLCQIQNIANLTHLTGLAATNEVIKAKLFKWHKNKKLKEFVLAVKAKLDQIYGGGNGNCMDTCTWPDFQSRVDREALTLLGRRSKFCVSHLDGIVRLQIETGEGEPGTAAAALGRMAILENSAEAEQAALPNGSGNHNTAELEAYPLRYQSGGQEDPIAKKYNSDLHESWNLNQLQQLQQRQEGALRPGAGQNFRKAEAMRLWDDIHVWIRRHDEIPALRTAGLLNRITPTSILPLLLTNTLDQRLGEQIEQVAIAWTHEQQAKRCLRLGAAGPSMVLALARELETIGYDKRLPPEWLLLQLEMDIKIRQVQVKVAEKMMAGKSSADHALMQLNMGEGKTSVIIPMLTSMLANGSQLCRVTVLKSLYTTNKKMLAFSIGGLLGQRVYTFPCRRDMDFDLDNVTTIHHLYEECLQKRGVVVTAPEYRLSLQLKLYEKCGSDCDTPVAQKLIQIHTWLRDHARDILDECDEILNVKYQLVYTIGDQQQVTGGQERWAVCQKLLKILPKHLDELLREGGSSHPKIELQYSRRGRRDGEWKLFPVCRILDADGVYPELCKRIAKDIVEGRTDIAMPELHSQDEKRLLRRLLTEPALSKEDHDEATDTFLNLKIASVTTAPHVTTILVLRGLLAYGVLLHCLSRRWRVNYGVNPKDRKQMAVPFRAKDIASERTEFGHMDVAILLTQLSYYYSGLTEAQVRECLHELDRCEDKDTKYKSWVDRIPDLDPSISTFAGINLADYDQTINVTIPTLRRNMLVIDFWLSKVVYPRECKQFRHKLTCTPWDLCSTEMKNPVTGFSGTNDTSLLLPLPIKQDDLPELKGTNGQVLFNLLQPENNKYAIFHLGITGRQILTKLVSEGIPLLLDIGALMIDLSNEQVARTWLSLAGGEHEYKAAVYFNDMDEIMVLDQRGRRTPLSLSPYRTNLEACLIYLDDVHTRGTDLKIPRGTTGCVTLGKGVTKDKLVQGCMRLRMLGNGHKVAFYASQEVDAEIRTQISREAKVGTKEVLLWAIKNSSIVTRDGFQHWTTAAANFYTKSGVHLLYDLSNHLDQDLKRLGDLCQEAEILDLKSLYGSFRLEEKFQVFVKGRMTALSRAFERNLPVSAPPEIIMQFEEGQTEVVKRCRTYTNNVKKFSTLLDEEQERELEHEEEEERQQRRPGRAFAAEPHLAPELARFIQSERPSAQSQSWLVPLPRVLPQLFNDGNQINVQEGSWGRNMYATKDFCRVIKREARSESVLVDGGEYIRPVTWFITKETQHGPALVLLSPIEANSVKNMFKHGLVPPATYLHMFAPRLHPDHSTFWATPQLTQPSSDGGHLNGGDFGIFNSNLLIFSGSLFFKDEEEQNYYCHFLGLVPNPRNPMEEQAVASNYIKNGWLLPEYRSRAEISSHGAAIWCKFQKNPVQLAQGIIECRDHILSDSTHAYKILHRSQKVEFIDMEMEEEDEAQELGQELIPMEED